jgi:hypothetical protein
MKPGRKASAHICVVAVAAGAALLGGGPLGAQPSSAPPPLLTAPARVDPAREAPPRPGIELSSQERQAIDAARGTTERPARIEDALAPTADDMKPRAAEDAAATTRIEQMRTSNRVSEVVVTPPGQTHSYVMTNREGRQPFGTTQMSSGLSVPMFLRFEFGKPTPPTNLPPPPAPTPSR